MKTTARKTTLANGIRVLTKPMPHVNSVSMGVWVNVGARDETDTESGLSHLIEHMIFKGTQKRSAFQIAKEFDAIGGQTNAFTTMENTCYHARVMDTHLDTMVDILSDILMNSAFDQKEIERERPVVLQEIGMVEDTPDEYIHVLLSQNFWGEHPLGRSILGTRDNLMHFDADWLKRFFKRFYQPEQIVIAVAGNVNHDYLIDLVNPTFETIKPGNGFPKRIPPAGNSRFVPTFRNLEQTHICIGTNGLSITDPRRFAFSLMNTILGGNMSSRLFQEIRENRGLAYSVYSFISSHFDTGLFGAYAAVDPKTAFEATRLILRAMTALQTDPVDAHELRGAKEYTKGNLLLAAESSDNQMVRLAQNEIHFNQYIPLQTVVDKIEAVTAEDIMELATDLFMDFKMAINLLGPLSETDSYETLLHR